MLSQIVRPMVRTQIRLLANSQATHTTLVKTITQWLGFLGVQATVTQLTTTASSSCPLKTSPFNPLLLEDGNFGFSLDTPPPSVIQSFRALNSDQRFIAHLKKLANLGEDTSVINDIEIKP